MHQHPRSLIVSAAIIAMAARVWAPAIRASTPPGEILWRLPADIGARDLLNGSGGPKGAPRPPYVFLKEDLGGTNPKFIVRDGNGVEWNVKLGIEARPEVAASRLVWATGYRTPDEYYLPELRVKNMPAHLHRGQKLIAPDGSIAGVRLKRRDLKKTGSWSWKDNPFLGTRELNGLKVMMALINNWDLKDENNAVFEKPNPQIPGEYESLYMVSDLGASFGSTGRSWPKNKSKGNLETYASSKFISRITAGSVDFAVPSRPALFYIVTLHDFISRLHLRWIGKDIPRSDALWIGRILARLSGEQIRDAFRAAGYSPYEVEGFSRVVIKRIGELNEL